MDSRSMKYMLEKYMLIGVAQLTKRESDRGKETFSCPSESTVHTLSQLRIENARVERTRARVEDGTVHFMRKIYEN